MSRAKNISGLEAGEYTYPEVTLAREEPVEEPATSDQILERPHGYLRTDPPIRYDTITSLGFTVAHRMTML